MELITHFFLFFFWWESYSSPTYMQMGCLQVTSVGRTQADVVTDADADADVDVVETLCRPVFFFFFFFLGGKAIHYICETHM